jgi:hypothetical protein
LKSEEKKREKERGTNAVSVPQTPVMTVAPTIPEVEGAANLESKEVSVQPEAAVAGATHEDEGADTSEAVDRNVRLELPVGKAH